MQGNGQIWISDLENKFLTNCHMRHNLKVILYLSEIATCIWSGSPKYDTFKEGIKMGGTRRNYILELSTVENVDDRGLTHYFLLNRLTPTWTTRAYTWTSNLSHYINIYLFPVVIWAVEGFIL